MGACGRSRWKTRSSTIRSGSFERQIAQQRAVDEGEHDHVHRDAERQRQHRGEGEPAILQEQATAVRDVGPESSSRRSFCNQSARKVRDGSNAHGALSRDPGRDEADARHRGGDCHEQQGIACRRLIHHHVERALDNGAEADADNRPAGQEQRGASRRGCRAYDGLAPMARRMASSRRRALTEYAARPVHAHQSQNDCQRTEDAERYHGNL